MEITKAVADMEVSFIAVRTMLLLHYGESGTMKNLGVTKDMTLMEMVCLVLSYHERNAGLIF